MERHLCIPMDFPKENSGGLPVGSFHRWFGNLYSLLLPEFLRGRVERHTADFGHHAQLTMSMSLIGRIQMLGRLFRVSQTKKLSHNLVRHIFVCSPKSRLGKR